MKTRFNRNSGRWEILGFNVSDHARLLKKR